MYDEEGPKSFYLVYEDFIGKQTDDPAERRSLAYQHLIHNSIRCVAAIDDNVKRVIDQLAPRAPSTTHSSSTPAIRAIGLANTTCTTSASSSKSPSKCR